MTAFRVTSQNLAVRSPLPSPLVAEALVDDRHRAHARHPVSCCESRSASGSSAGSRTRCSKSERANAPGEPYYPYDFDQTHVLARGRVVRPRRRLRGRRPLPLRDRLSRGRRSSARTSTRKTGTYEPFFGALNSIRIPAFWQLDVRVSKRFTHRRGSALEAYLDVQNVTNRSNPEEIVYSPDYSQRRYITGLPILPVLGARLSW